MNIRTFAFVFAAALPALADSTVSPAARFSYGGNIGWLNGRHDQPFAPSGLVVSEYTITGRAYGANIGWIGFGVTPAGGVRFSQFAGDTGVNHDGTGNLSGWAYGANVGWISFNWAAPVSPNRPQVDLSTGAFSGYAYGANIGWINLATLTTQSIAAPDTDGDQMADAWEREHFGNLTTAALGTDADGDGASDVAEYTAMTAPNNSSDFFKIVSQFYDVTMTTVVLQFTTTQHRRYRLQWSPDLATWVNDATHGIFAPDPGATTTRAVTFPSGAKRFFRAIAIKPLQN